MLLSRYASIEYVMKMEASQGVKLIVKAIETHNEEKMFFKWLHDDARYKVSFSDYLKAGTPYRKSTDKEKDEILKKWGGK